MDEGQGESFHSDSNELPWAGNGASNPAIQLRLAAADVERDRMIYAPL